MIASLPTLAEVRHVAAVAGEVLGALFTICSAVGNPLSRTTGRAASFGHLVLAFGADIGKAKKRLADLFNTSEPY